MIRIAKYLVLIILILTLASLASAQPLTIPNACTRHITIPSTATVIELSDIRDCVMIVTVRSKGQRFWRIESTHDITTLHKDACLWWNGKGRSGLHKIERLMKQIAKTCTFRLNVRFHDGAKLQRWRVRIVETEGLSE